MPRRGENIYKRKDGRWEGRYIRGRTPAGKAEYGYVYAKSYAACREKRRKMEGIIPQKPTLTGEMSVAQAVAFFLSDRRGELKASTVGRYEYVPSHYIVPDLGTVMLHELTAEKLSAYFKRLQNRGLSSKTVRDIGVLLKTVFKVVKKKCHCDCPGRDAELPAYRGKETEVLGDHTGTENLGDAGYHRVMCSIGLEHGVTAWRDMRPAQKRYRLPFRLSANRALGRPCTRCFRDTFGGTVPKKQQLCAPCRHSRRYAETAENDHAAHPERQLSADQ